MNFQDILKKQQQQNEYTSQLKFDNNALNLQVAERDELIASLQAMNESLNNQLDEVFYSANRV